MHVVVCHLSEEYVLLPLNLVLEEFDKFNGRRSFTQLQGCLGITQVIDGVLVHKVGQLIRKVMLSYIVEDVFSLNLTIYFF